MISLQAALLDTDAKLAAARGRVYEELRRTLKPRLQAELAGALARVKPRNQHDLFPPVWKSNLRRVHAIDAGPDASLNYGKVARSFRTSYVVRLVIAARRSP